MADNVESVITGKVNVQTGEYEYKTLMRLLGVSVSKHLLDEHFTLVWANDFYYELIGWEKEEYESTFHNRPDLYYIGHEREWKELSEAVMEAAMNHASGYRLVTRMPRKDGGHIWVQISNSFADEYINGYQVSYTVMTNIDETVRIQKEQSVTYNNLPGFVGKFLVEENGFQFISGNSRFEEFFGDGTRNKLSCGLTNQVTVKNCEALRKNFPLMQRGEQVHFTLQARNRQGRDTWLQANADCIDWINGKPVYLVIYIDITDITEQRELQNQLEERSAMLHSALEAAEQANQAKSEFLSRMSHDIRTPMNAIIGMTSIAGSHIDDKERVLNCLEKITLSSKLLLGLINEVLDMSRIESGRVILSKEAFSMSDLLQNIITVIQPSAAEKHHTLDIHAFSVEHEDVIGDPQHIQQVFLNILSNAVKYTPDYGKIIFTIKEKKSDIPGLGCYEFIFEDNGYGMKPEFLEKIFEPFERAEDSDIRAIQGTGLGMAISRNIVKMMDGDIMAESVYGKGSRFTVTLYLQIQSVENTQPYFAPEFPVLVVDDDQVACETVCERLEEIGLTGRWVLSGKEAIQCAVEAHSRKEDFFAVIVDMKMPDMDGIETTRQIREKVGADIPIILISAYDWPEYESEAVEAGADGFIVKPMLKGDLVYAIRKYVLKEETAAVYNGVERPQRSFAGRHLLLVEDNDFNREIGEEIIGQTGIEVLCAENGREAVRMFAASEPGYYGMIFMDLQMPVMDGFEATHCIREMEREDAGTVPIVAMTANAFAEDVEASLAAGMNEHLAKPLDVERLYQVMEQFIK